MAETIKPIIKVEAGDSQKTIKQLKEDIKNLRDNILNLTKGTDEYNDAVEQLQANQRQLDEVMSLTKKTATALDGSYDALTHKMAQLKKEWRATADEAKRADLGGQIEEINQQLKEMDASVGNFQRNVGNYVSHWEGMPEVTKDFGAAMREMNEQIEPTKAKFESVSQIASGLASGFAAVQGAAALFGLENENLEKTLVKVQAAMALAQGIGGLSGLVEGLGKAKVAFQGMITSIKAVTAAMSATGWLAVIVAVSAAIAGLVGWIKKAKEETDTLSKDMATMAENAIEVAGGLGEEIAKLKIYQSVAEDVTQSMEKRNSAATEGLRLLGEEITETNIAAFKNGEYADKINAVTTALINKAKVEGAYNLIKEKYNQALQRQLELEEQARNAKEEENKLREQQKNNQTTTKQKVAAAGLNMMANDPMMGVYGGSSEVTTAEDVRDTDIEIWERRANEYSNAAKQVMVDADNEVKNFLANLTKDGIDFSSLVGGNKPTGGNGGGGGGGGTPKPKTLEDILAEIQQKLYEDAVNMVIEDIPIDITDSGSKSVGYQYKDGDAQKRYGFWNNIIDAETSQAVRRSKLDGGTQEEQDALIIKGEERKLAKLKEFWEMARQKGDVTGELELRQQIADQELTIEEEKNRAILESEERTKERRKQIINEVSQALSAAGSVAQGILEITQAAAEKDKKITEQEAKRIKGMQIAVATMNMLAGITAALSGAFTTKTGPWDIALAAVQAATIAASGTANIMKIKNTDLTGNVSSGAMGAVTPNSNVFGTNIPMSYVRNVTTASETDALNQDTRVYILESDIQESSKKVQVRENESTF